MNQVVELKVGLHCEECIKMILKAIKKIQGIIIYYQPMSFLFLLKWTYKDYCFELTDIETYDVDTRLNKVTVTGNVTNQQVMKALQKIGKQATNWEQDSTST